MKLLAFDYGASSGRGILAEYDGNFIKLEEVHRFTNDPVMAGGTFYWDFLRLFHEMKTGMSKANKLSTEPISSMGIDTWGVDFGLLDKKGRLMGNPVHYRDARNDGMMEEAFKIVPKREIYGETGIQFLKFNTLYQLLSMKLEQSPLLEKAETMLFIPDLFNYLLTGVKASEYTIASTSQMMDPRSGKWATGLLSQLGIPRNILADIVTTGTVIGDLSTNICDELNIKPIPVIAVAEHDTGSAVVSVPATGGKYAYLSSGTWSLLGLELNEPVITDRTYALNHTNEGGINNTIRLLKNIMGLWIYQECMRVWAKEGETPGYDELGLMAYQAEPFASLIDPDSDEFGQPGHMPGKVAEYCSRTGQKVPVTKGEIVRCIMESLALKYRLVLEGLEEVADFEIDTLHIVGGGTQNDMLNCFTANSIGKPVVTGPVEATAIGNIASQLISLGEVSGLSEARALIKKSFPVREYLPQDRDSWNEAYVRFLRIIGAA